MTDEGRTIHDLYVLGLSLWLINAFTAICMFLFRIACSARPREAGPPSSPFKREVLLLSRLWTLLVRNPSVGRGDMEDVAGVV